MQARARPRRRVPRVPRRQRLRRGVGDAAPLPREPAQLDLGGLAATSSASTSCARWSSSPASVESFFAEVADGAARRAPPRPPSPPTLRDELPGDIADDRDPRPPRRRAHGPRPPGLAAGPLRRRGRRRRLLRHAASTATGAAPSAPCRPALDYARIIERHRAGRLSGRDGCLAGGRCRTGSCLREGSRSSGPSEGTRPSRRRPWQAVAASEMAGSGGRRSEGSGDRRSAGAGDRAGDADAGRRGRQRRHARRGRGLRRLLMRPSHAAPSVNGDLGLCEHETRSHAARQAATGARLEPGGRAVSTG